LEQEEAVILRGLILCLLGLQQLSVVEKVVKVDIPVLMLRRLEVMVVLVVVVVVEILGALTRGVVELQVKVMLAVL
jgi:hypothetical protein|tara:strand:+ start:150 stop:377 length:228 start_codon:yes stop_codon:yes gene_type:complete